MNSLFNFIENVASSNLETFHSKAITWLLNTNEDTNHNIFRTISENTNVPVGSRHLKSIAEFKSHDIISLFEAESKYHLVFWENKIKADFHLKMLNIPALSKNENGDRENLLKVEEYQRALNRGLSQPYYYQVRHYLNVHSKGCDTWLNQFSNNLLDSITLTKANTNFHWVILSPHKKNDLDKFHNGTWNGYDFNTQHEHLSKGDKAFVKNLDWEGYSSWKFLTYKELFENTFDDLEAVQSAYLEYIKSQNYFKQTPKSEGWSLEALQRLHKELQLKNPNYIYKWNVVGSAKTPNPLLNICFSLHKFLGNSAHSELPEFKNIIKYKKIGNLNVENTEVDRITVNVQLQGRAIKIQFSHWDYDNVTLTGTKSNKGFNYALALFSYLSPGTTISDKSSLIEAFTKWIDFDEIESIDKVNLPTTKTGLSFSLSYNIESKSERVQELCQALKSLTTS